MQEKKRIFIADDEEMILDMLSKLLKLSGFEVAVTQDSREAVSIIKSFKPHLIILDLLMPHLGGIDLCEMLNGDKETAGIPIIIISALSGYADVKRAYKLGVTGYIQKPFDFQKLLQEINKNIAYKETDIQHE